MIIAFHGLYRFFPDDVFNALAPIPCDSIYIPCIEIVY